MGKTFKFVALVVAIAAFAAPAAAAAAPGATARGAVYTLTNAASGNAVVVFARAADGSLAQTATTSTGGLGTGANLGSQGAIVLSENGKRLFAVNAGSDSVSEFSVRDDGLKLEATWDAGGSRPISLTVDRNLLYVLDAGGTPHITGFRVDGLGRVAPIDGSTQPLLGTNPAQVAFSPDGSELVVTNKGTSTLDTFAVAADGRAQAAVSSPSAGATPFGFAFDSLGRAFVSEAAGSASSYSIDASGAHVITGAAATGQAAPCWLVVTPDGRYAYTANAGSATISGFAIAANGSLTLLGNGAAASLGAGAHPLDEAVSPDGSTLSVLVDGRHSVATYRIAADGSLSLVGETGSLPAGTVGLASS